jgi:hypothetical protein
MLTHKAVGPYEDGSYLVVYPTPGCSSLTVACVCRTDEQAEGEVRRLNQLQLRREQNIRRDRELRGLGGTYHEIHEIG